jgi:diaminopimelate epimerase
MVSRCSSEPCRWATRTRWSKWTTSPPRRCSRSAPRCKRDAAFPQSVNVGFAEVDARDRIRLRVYERGVGETLACGSGACAAAAILMRRGRIDREVTVVLPGGELQIPWPDDAASITMAGPATFRF